MDGFEVIRRAGPSRTPETIFVTGYDRHAIRAFESSSLDYLLKPYEAPRFRDVLERARQRTSAQRAPERSQQLGRMLTTYTTRDASDAVAGDERAAPLDRFVIKGKEGLVSVNAIDVDWIESARNYVRLHVGDSTHTMRETLAALEARLDPTRFARMHRRIIVNLERVREVQPWFGGDHVVILTNGHKLRLSRSFRRRFLERLQRAK
jgi:two-component system LytT family response regulator